MAEPPGVNSARRLLAIGFAEATVRRVLVTEVRLTEHEADAALAHARADVALR
ncbi:MAG: hypothetical protein KatS3mg009_2858 [Acidimicrobiia bacterium]|nr:MAG: hypothetical protein KatS3mg009_2858 [Acidimicrobiia bacterium]